LAQELKEARSQLNFKDHALEAAQREGARARKELEQLQAQQQQQLEALARAAAEQRAQVRCCCGAALPARRAQDALIV
jgi:chromosome segregation ATPase